MKNEIANNAIFINGSKLLEKILNGYFDEIISLDIVTTVKKYNAGDTSVLDDEKVISFVNNGEYATELCSLILALKRMISYKDAFLKTIEDKKNGMIYNPKDIYYEDRDYYGRNVTYQEVLDAILIAEKVLNNNKIYQILNYYLKHESLIDEIRARITVHRSQRIVSNKREKFLDALRVPDGDVGIIRVDDTEKGVQVYAGTRKDMIISDLIGRPFTEDMDREGYDYGPYGDYYMPPRKVTKTFHEGGETALHKKMIKDERTRRANLALTSTEEQGFIICSECAIIVSRKELTDAGIDPESIGWKPLSLKVKQRKLISLRKVYSGEQNLKERLLLKKDLLIRGR